MAPLPDTIDQETTRLIENLNRRQEDLSTYQIPRLRECKTSLVIQQQYASELREDLNIFAQLIEKLDLAVEDQRRPKDRDVVRYLADDFRATCARLRKDVRAALLESKKAIDQQSRSNREELFKSTNTVDQSKRKEKTGDDALMDASNNVTEALRRTIGLMQGELERSVLSVQMLESSTATLQATSSTHDTLTSVMGTSRQLITALEKADWIDRLIIFAALTFFILVVLFILKQRLVDRSIRLAFWWTRFIPNFGGDHALLRAREQFPPELSQKLVESASMTSVSPALSTALTLATSSSMAAVSVPSSSASLVVSLVDEGGLDTRSSVHTTAHAEAVKSPLDPIQMQDDYQHIEL